MLFNVLLPCGTNFICLMCTNSNSNSSVVGFSLSMFSVYWLLIQCTEPKEEKLWLWRAVVPLPLSHPGLLFTQIRTWSHLPFLSHLDCQLPGPVSVRHNKPANNRVADQHDQNLQMSWIFILLNWFWSECYIILGCKRQLFLEGSTFLSYFPLLLTISISFPISGSNSCR